MENNKSFIKYDIGFVVRSETHIFSADMELSPYVWSILQSVLGKKGRNCPYVWF